MNTTHCPTRRGGRGARQRLALPLLALTLLVAGGCAGTRAPQMADPAGEAGPPDAARTADAPSERGADAPADDAGPSDIEPHVVSYPDYRDPLAPVNRITFAFNDRVYRHALLPLARGYRRTVPDPVRTGVGNFFYNLKSPIYVVNHLLQVDPADAGHSLLRFGINSTVGVLGLFDVADAAFDLERRETHLDETLMGYGVGYGIYVVIPLIGPSDLRNGASLVGDWLLNPVPYLLDPPASTAVQGVDAVQRFAPEVVRYQDLLEETEAPYRFFRNLHLQGVQRDAER